KILACREGNSHEASLLGSALRVIYDGHNSDLRQLEITPDEEAYSLVVNDGLFAGSRAALLALDGVIRAMPQASSWADASPSVGWRNQFIFNLALARLQCGVELDSTYNVQLHVQDIEFQERAAQIVAYWRNREARLLHFNGGAKQKYHELQGKFANTPDPLPAGGPGDAYSGFLQALRAWIGRYGVQ